MIGIVIVTDFHNLYKGIVNLYKRIVILYKPIVLLIKSSSWYKKMVATQHVRNDPNTGNKCIHPSDERLPLMGLQAFMTYSPFLCLGGKTLMHG
jgi:hypothetical protein